MKAEVVAHGFGIPAEVPVGAVVIAIVATAVLWMTPVATAAESVLVTPLPADPPRHCEDTTEADNFCVAKWAPTLPPIAASTTITPTANNI